MAARCAIGCIVAITVSTLAATWAVLAPGPPPSQSGGGPGLGPDSLLAWLPCSTSTSPPAQTSPTTTSPTSRAAFAAALGFTVGLTEHRNRARTDELPVDLLRSWAEGGAAGYSLLAIDGPIPDDLLEPYAALLTVMNEAPRGELAMDDDDVTPDELRALHDAEMEKGTVRWTLVARHDATGELAGLTELLLPRHQRWRAVQENTGVATAHRGHGLGRVLKASNALRLLDERPDALVIETWNAGVNEHMLAINHAMGFRAEAVQQIVQADTAPLVERLRPHR